MNIRMKQNLQDARFCKLRALSSALSYGRQYQLPTRSPVGNNPKGPKDPIIRYLGLG